MDSNNHFLISISSLLSESFAEENDGSLEVPAASLRPNLSITNNLSNCNLKSLALDDDDLRHEHHNPIVKALSNSNLNLFDEPHHPKYVHSAACLVDLSINEDMEKHSRSVTSLQPPKRPPPPPASFSNTQNKQELVQPLIQIEPLISIESEEKVGFDDDFGKLHISNSFSLPNQTQTNTNNAPPLPPLPSTLPVSSTQSQTKTVFDLFDDSFDPFAPFDNSSSTTSRNPTTNNKPSPPPFPASLPANTIAPSSQPIVPTRPPPLPPMPTTLPKTSQFMNDTNFNPFASTTFNQPIVPKVPVRPSPPPVLPLPPQRPPPVFLTNNNNNVNNNNIYNQVNQVKKELSDVDLLGDPGDAPPPPLPPPKMDHFI